ncbi:MULTISPECIES: plasma-membrane proton-efflux P-type ATPase [Novosphingobium]|uniref:plasma-membrane proton-efflux P-type ATPase n=1 Tax=Novosphingobium TaxID=165696 RepID=UPI00020EEDCC|nr:MULTISPECIES: plasma-membrane proton-efflux P-type ATPase [Novosphingobium]CCA93130.1 plasma-membrane proton-efflux P-type ATPase [Novosphingobium sp. PP1Y]
MDRQENKQPSLDPYRTPAPSGTLTGLSADEAHRLLAQYGENTIQERRVSPLRKLLSFFWGPIPWMIEVAAALSAAVQHWEDFAIILVLLLLNAGVGFWEEHKADNAIEALKQRLAPNARVLRDGTWQDLAARLLVPGDVVLIKLGNIVPADVALREGDYLSIDQSALTGESLPVDKKQGDTAYSGSVVRQGEMRAVVTATGMDTYFGKTARLVATAQPRSHFQQAVLRIGNFLILMTIGLVAVILLAALFQETPLVETLLFALILTVAAIPVALPAVLSVTMAVGASTLAGMKAIVSRLVSIEEMAGMDILCSDKTGTLTRNELTLGEPVLAGGQDRKELLLAAALTCAREAPDAIDAAILGGIDEKALAGFKVAHFEPFDPVRKRAEAEVQSGSDRFKVAKGAPQVILDLAKTDPESRSRIEKTTDDLAGRGYRTLGVARSEADGVWTFLGLLPLFDPPREDSAETIATAKRMGLDVRMVTGDHVAIAREISKQLGLGADIVSAREVFTHEGHDGDGARIEGADGFVEVFPEHKFKIVRTLQQAGHIVGMTGDGVNDAPALKQADIGIAVSGATDAARAAAALVLTAPGLSVITQAAEEARRIFERMTGYATFRIAETIRVLLFMTLSILVFDFYPVTAVMIVLLAILNDFPILTIAYDNVRVAGQPVRWDMHRVLTISTMLGLLGVIASFLLFWIAERYLALPRPTIQTLIFLKLLVAGHLTIYLTRNEGWFWQRPWPSWKLIVATETTQVLGTLATVYGWFVEPIGWTYALLIWGYALIWFLFNNLIKVWTYRMLRSGPSWHARHLARVHGTVHGRECAPATCGRRVPGQAGKPQPERAA